MSKKRFHKITGHAGEAYMEATAKHMGIQLTGTVKKCLHCALEKIRQANIPKEHEDTSTIPGEGLFLNISSYKAKSLGSNRHWVLLVDEATRFKKSFFVPHKAHQNELIIEWVKDLKATSNIIIKCI